MPKRKPRAKPRGKPFPKGTSGNPEGKALKTNEERLIQADVRRYAKLHTREAVDKLVGVMRGEPYPVSDDNGKVVLARPSIALQKEAAVDILNRGHGTPAQSVEFYDVAAFSAVAERESALESLESSLAELAPRVREAEGLKLIN